ncbi:TonB-dependent receptor domain-containing protein [Steroidobacter flavus]|uniref:TonB-dependent receptor domain-containing protein n=1 Tax=Steroidobacter flavus TaxID=1842136 RepID=A0ABV8SY12_9GAMM
MTAAISVVVAAPARAEQRVFDLPAQEATTGIPAFAQQAGIQILVSESAARNRRTAEVVGEFSIQAALERLLSGSGLNVLFQDAHTIVLAPEVRGTASSTELEEIVVTAFRRDELLQEVPAAVSVLRRSNLKAKGAQDYRDYLTTIPGVNFTQSASSAMRVTIRGVSDGIGGTDPLTGIYIDETPITESFTATLDPSIYDVDRIEVLKGPQGTLYGSGSMGGTVRVITNKPKLDALEASVHGRFGTVAHGDQNRRVDGVLNVPLTARSMALRVSAGHREDAGWIDDVARHEKDGNTVDKSDAHAQWLLRPGEATSILVSFLYQKERAGLPFFHDFALPEHQTARAFRQSSESQARLSSITLEQIWDEWSLTSASGYLHKEGTNTSDTTNAVRPLLSDLANVDLGPTEGTGLRTDSSLTSFTQEVRLASRGEHRVDWVAGVFYSNNTSDFPQTFDFSQAPSTNGVTSGAEFYSSAQRYRARQIATFGEATWNVTEQLSLTGGLRAFDVDQRNVLSGSGTLNGGATVWQQQASNSSTIQKYLLKYQPRPDRMIYAQAGQGYRNGGPTGGFPHTACAADLAAIGFATVPSQFGPDTLWNYEIGSKNTLLEGRMALNGAAFYIDWSDIQNAISLPCGFGFTTNAGRAASKGAELETSLTPVRGLTLTAGVSYVDATLTRAAIGVPARDGDPLPLTAKWSANVSAEYERHLGRNVQGFVRGELNYVGERWNMFRSNTARARLLDDYATVSMRVGLTSGAWSAALFANNLTDERIVSFTPGTNYEIVGSPRVVGVDVTYDF